MHMSLIALALENRIQLLLYIRIYKSFIKSKGSGLYKEGGVTGVQAVGMRKWAEVSYGEVSCTSGTAVESYRLDPEEDAVTG